MIVIIIGINIGVGVLSMVYVVCKVGYVLLLVCLVLICFFCIVIMFYVIEVCLRICGNNQFSGFFWCYLGLFGGWLIFIVVVVNSYGVLVVYMIGSGNIMFEFFGQYGFMCQVGSLIFFVFLVLVFYLGLKVFGVGEKLISVGMVVIVCIFIGVILMYDDVCFVYFWQSQW